MRTFNHSTSGVPMYSRAGGIGLVLAGTLAIVGLAVAFLMTAF